MSNAIQGQLAEGVLANLLQYLSFNQASGCLTLMQDDTQGSIYFEQGNVVHIVSAPEIDVAALSRLLNWTTGQFRFQSRVAPPRRTTKISVDRLLLQASYEADVSAMDSRRRLNETSVLTPASMSADAPHTVEMTLRAVQILRYLDGHNNLADIARLLKLPTEEVLKGAHELLEQGLVALTEAPSTQQIAEVWGRALGRFEGYVEQKHPGTFRKGWLKVCNHLADDYPALDPFAPDVVYEEGELILEVEDLEPEEFTEALVLAVQHLVRLFRIEPEKLPAILGGERLAPPYLLEAAGLDTFIRRSP